MSSRKLIEQYLNGWREGDIQRITKILTKACIIIESHGPKYKGIKEIIKWIEDWNKNKNKINMWHITSFYQTENTAIFEWKFSCTVNGKLHNIDGISIAKIKNNKISFLREYKMAK